MVELKFTVSDVDFDTVIQALAGQLAPPVVLAARAMPDEAKEELVVRYINANAGQMERQFEAALAAKGVRLKISGAKATLVTRKSGPPA